jgi:DNA-binding response OmpR family regulator
VKDKLLIIDDDITFASFLRGVLSQKGYDVVCCSDLDAAEKELSSSWVPAVVVLDYVIGGHTTENFAEALRARRAETKIVVISGTCSGEETTKLQQMVSDRVIDAYLAKPFGTKELLEAI